MSDRSIVIGVTLNILVWLCWSVLVGYLGHRWPHSAFMNERWWSRLRSCERGGACYSRTLRINRWKDLLPELGGAFSGGFAKRSTNRRRPHIERFIIETRRAEAVHWWLWLLWPAFALWNPPWAVGVMALYATVANVPCLLVQRYNRARLLDVIARLDRRERRHLHSRTPALPHSS